MGIPIIQEPQIVVAIQELIWKVKPDLIIETGVAHGGSLILSASVLSVLGGNRVVIGIDNDLHDDNRKAILSHPLAGKILLVDGSSIDPLVVESVTTFGKVYSRIMVVLDSDHTHNHVLAELRAYAPLVSNGSYCIVCDTGIDDLPKELLFGRPWGKGNNPKTAVHEYLKENQKFKIDNSIEKKLGLPSNPDGWLKHE